MDITYPVHIDSLMGGEVEGGDEVVDVAAAHRRSVQVGGQHGAEEGLPGTGTPVERQYQRPVGIIVGQKVLHLFGHDVLS